MNKYFRIILKVLKISAIALLSLFLAVFILIQTPKVQTWLVQQVTELLSETLQTEASIQKVDLDLFKTAVLEGIFIKDQQSDTLLFATKLKADIGVFSLFKKEIFLNTIQLEGAVANLSKIQDDSIFNFQFIINALSSNKPKTGNNNSNSGWGFGIGRVVIDDTRFKLTDRSKGGFELETEVGHLLVIAEKLDYQNNNIALSDLNLEKSSVKYTLFKNDQQQVIDSTLLNFPALGWEINVGNLKLEENRFKFSNLNYERQLDIVDYNYLDFKDISLKISDISLKDTSMNANIHRASFADHSGLFLKNLSTDISLNNKSISSQNLRFETPHSSLKSNLQLSFNDFGDLSDFMNKVRLEASFEPTQVSYRDLTKLVAVFRNIPYIKTDIDEKIALEGNIVLQKNSILFEDFYSKIGNLFSLDASGSIAQLTSDPYFDLSVKKLITDFNNFIYLTKNIALPEGLKQFGSIDFSGNLTGIISDLKGEQLNLTTESATLFAGDLNIRGLPEIEKTIFEATVKELVTDAKDIEAISNTKFPAILDSLGNIKFSGKYEGTIYKFVVNGDFQTSAGEMKTDLDLNFEKDYQNAKYDGNIEFRDVDLSKILNKPFGKTSFNIETKGSGLNIKDLNLSADGVVSSFDFQNYTYQNLSLKGVFLKKRFNGLAQAEDENLRFDFQGMVDLNDSLPDMQMVLNVDTINLKALNLYSKNLGFSGNLEADLKGNKLDNINGVATLQKFSIALDSIAYSTAETISLEAESTDLIQKALHFRSDFMDANINGKFTLADFPKSIINFVNEFFPLDDLIVMDSSSQKLNQVEEQDVAFDFEFKDISSFARIFLPDFLAADTAFINGHFNSSVKQLSLLGSFPNLTYGDLKVDTIQISSNGTPQDIETTIMLNQASLSGFVNLPLVTLNTLFTNDTLSFGLNILGEEPDKNVFVGDSTFQAAIDNKLDLKGIISNANDLYTLSFLPEFVLNDELWKIAAKNKIEFDNKSLTFSNLGFLKGEQGIDINSRGDAPENDFKPIEVLLTNFNLEEISEMLGMTEDKFGGRVNGELIFIEPKTNLHYNSEIIIDSLSYNEKIVGKLDIKAKQASTEQLIELAVQLEGEYQMSIAGNYGIKERIFDLDFKLGKLPLFLIDPVTTGILKESNGYLSGEMKLKGTPERPDVNGAIKLEKFSTTAVLTNMHYLLEETTIQISEEVVDLGTIILKDANNKSAVLSGKINHNYFQDLRFDLTFETDAFQFLNTTVAENELYFGKLFLKASMAITGTPDLPKLTIDALTLPNTQLFVQPFSEEETIKQEDYIIFANPEFYNEDSLILVEQRIRRSRSIFDLSLKLRVTDDATVNVIVDPSTGDQLICAGTANLNVNYNPAGVITVAGNYTIEKGSYSLNYEQLVKRDFEIKKGSSIIFSGDPMNAAFDVTASYKVRASTYELLANQTVLSEPEKQASNQRTDVIVLMFLKGNLNEPDITFDIQIPGTQEEGISSALNRKLAELRTNPDELNKQAFGLLLFKSFITESGSNTSLSDAGANIALSSVSNLLTDQLNRFADRYTKGFEIDIGVESYTSGDQSSTLTQMQLNVSKQLFKDRLTVNVGTNVNLNAQSTGSIFQSNVSGIAGDFVLEYKLTESGTYNVKVFHQNDYNALEQSNAYKSGAGIIFRKSFNGKNYKE